jgi:two-component SAPR family response regulator
MQGDLNFRPHIGALYRWHGDNMSSKNQAILAKEKLQILEEVSPMVVRHYKMDESVQNKLALRTAQFAMNNGRPDRAIELLVEKADQAPLDDQENLILLYSLYLANHYHHAKELCEILNSRKHHHAPHLLSDLEKISSIIMKQTAIA